MMTRAFALLAAFTLAAFAQQPRTYATRDPHTPGYVRATELPDATLPPANEDGNFILGPTHPPAPEMTANPAVPQGTVTE
ncbi:MAG: esterase family protein, partial [Acidobacteriaceae bacterium]